MAHVRQDHARKNVERCKNQTKEHDGQELFERYRPIDEDEDGDGLAFDRKSDSTTKLLPDTKTPKTESLTSEA